MIYNLLYDNPNEDLLTRLLKIRKIDDNPKMFLHPTFGDYRNNPFLLKDMDKAVDRIIKAMKNNEKIMVFGDYDVDGVTSSYILYKFLTKFLDYKNVSIQYPDRIKDGYGIKNHHIDDIKSKGVDLIITVDNGITSIQEAKHAKKIGIDLIITDHHHPLEEIPAGLAVINPLISPDYPFKGLAGVGVAFKLINAVLEKSTFNKDQKTRIFNYFLPIVAIGTVADVVPLINENRVIVKRGLHLINNKKDHIPSSLKGFLDFLNLKKDVDTYHIGFMIGPRINAGGRIESPYDSLKMLLYSGEKQIEYLEKIEGINTERRRLQDVAFKEAEQQLQHDDFLLVARSEDFHEGIVGIVSGKITEKYNKPSVIFKIDKEKNQAVASLRGPDYFDIIGMIGTAQDILERFGGHKCAGGLAVKLENLDEVIVRFQTYCKKNIKETDLPKTITIDTKIYPQEREQHLLQSINEFAPFGEGNEEPSFLFENVEIKKIEKVGNGTKSHLKIHGIFGDKKVTSMFWGKGDQAEIMNKDMPKEFSLLGRIRADSFNGGYYIEGIEIVS